MRFHLIKRLRTFAVFIMEWMEYDKESKQSVSLITIAFAVWMFLTIVDSLFIHHEIELILSKLSSEQQILVEPYLRGLFIRSLNISVSSLAGLSLSLMVILYVLAFFWHKSRRNYVFASILRKMLH